MVNAGGLRAGVSLMKVRERLSDNPCRKTLLWLFYSNLKDTGIVILKVFFFRLSFTPNC